MLGPPARSAAWRGLHRGGVALGQAAARSRARRPRSRLANPAAAPMQPSARTSTSSSEQPLHVAPLSLFNRAAAGRTLTASSSPEFNSRRLACETSAIRLGQVGHHAGNGVERHSRIAPYSATGHRLDDVEIGGNCPGQQSGSAISAADRRAERPSLAEDLRAAGAGRAVSDAGSAAIALN